MTGAALSTEPLLDVVVHLEPTFIGGPAGNRVIFALQGGRFEGPRLRGDVLPGGGDWLLGRADGYGELDIRATFRTDDGALIYVRMGGVIGPLAKIFERVARGESLDAGEIYARSTPRFETGAAAYDWLNTTIAVGVGAIAPGRVSFAMHRIL